jgi:hypothetical protein
LLLLPPLLLQDVFLRTWFTCYLYGQLSWVQLARMHVSAANMHAAGKAALPGNCMVAAMLCLPRRPLCGALWHRCCVRVECVTSPMGQPDLCHWHCRIECISI